METRELDQERARLQRVVMACARGMRKERNPHVVWMLTNRKASAEGQLNILRKGGIV